MSRSVGGNERVSGARAAYERLRAAHLSAVQAALEDHVARLRLVAGTDRALPRPNGCGRCLHSRASARRFTRRECVGHRSRPRPRSPTWRGCRVMTKRGGAGRVGRDRHRSRPRPRAAPSGFWPSSNGFRTRPAGQQMFSSGGSSGVRGVYVWDWELFVPLACLAWRMQAREERRAGRSGARRGSPCWRPASRRTPARRCSMCATAAGMADRRDPGGGTVRRGARRGGGRPADPSRRATRSVIGRLARAALAGGLDIRPVRVSTNSEPLIDEDRQAIRDAWDAPVHNLWGSTEIGVQAVGCGRGEGLHVCEDEVVLERVDEDGAPGRPGRARRAHARDRAGQPDVPVHPLRPRRRGHAAARARAHAEARSRASPTSPVGATTTSATASVHGPRERVPVRARHRSR